MEKERISVYINDDSICINGIAYWDEKSVGSSSTIKRKISSLKNVEYEKIYSKEVNSIIKQLQTEINELIVGINKLIDIKIEKTNNDIKEIL